MEVHVMWNPASSTYLPAKHHAAFRWSGGSQKLKKKPERTEKPKIKVKSGQLS